jgi:hypothetical protein
VGADHRDQPLRLLLHDACRVAGHAGAGLGTDRQHRLGPWSRSIGRQIRLCRRKARIDRPDAHGRARDGAQSCHLQRDLSGMGPDPARRKAGPGAGRAGWSDAGRGDDASGVREDAVGRSSRSSGAGAIGGLSLFARGRSDPRRGAAGRRRVDGHRGR